MEREDLQRILREYKEQTGMHLRLVQEDGATIVSTWSLRGQFLLDSVEGRLGPAEQQERASGLGIELGDGCVLCLVEGEALSQTLVQTAAEEILAEELLPDAGIADEAGRSILILRADDLSQAEELAGYLQSGLEVEAMSRVRIGVSRIFAELRDLREAYREARMALLAMHSFTTGDRVRVYTDLGLTLAALEIPERDAAMYLHSVMGSGAEAVFTDSELLRTAKVFFDTGLNSAETARRLCVHRNTLNYRLDKICRLSGRDLKQFDDAAAFQLAALLWERLQRKEAGTGGNRDE